MKWWTFWKRFVLGDLKEKETFRFPLFSDSFGQGICVSSCSSLLCFCLISNPSFFILCSFRCDSSSSCERWMKWGMIMICFNFKRRENNNGWQMTGDDEQEAVREKEKQKESAKGCFYPISIEEKEVSISVFIRSPWARLLFCWFYFHFSSPTHPFCICFSCMERYTGIHIFRAGE